MKVKATVSFGGAVSMHKDEIRDIPTGDNLKDLLKAGYVEKVKGKDVGEADNDT